jgi:protein-disulfide isomerase
MKRGLDVIATVAFISVCVVFVWKNLSGATDTRKANRPNLPIPSDPVSLDGLQVKGSKTAKVGIIEFSDFECPFCGQLEQQTMPAIDREFVSEGKVLVAFNHMPLVIHAHAFDAAEAAECAGNQGKFWQAHNLLFQGRENLVPAAIVSKSRTLGMEPTKLEECISSHRMKAAVEAAVRKAKELHVTSTPTLFAGSILPDGRLKVAYAMAGFQPIESLRPVIAQILAGSTP